MRTIMIHVFSMGVGGEKGGGKAGGDDGDLVVTGTCVVPCEKTSFSRNTCAGYDSAAQPGRARPEELNRLTVRFSSLGFGNGVRLRLWSMSWVFKERRWTVSTREDV